MRVGRQAPDEGPALILVNYDLPRALLERLWFNATLRVCADGAINRLYATFDNDADRARFIPEYVRGDLDSVDVKVCICVFLGNGGEGGREEERERGREKGREGVGKKKEGGRNGQ